MKKLTNALTQFVHSLIRIANAYAEQMETSTELNRKLIPLADEIVTLASKFTPVYAAVNRQADVIIPQIAGAIDAVGPTFAAQLGKEIRKAVSELDED